MTLPDRHTTKPSLPRPGRKNVVPQKSNANSYKIWGKCEFAQDFTKFIPATAGGHMGPPLLRCNF